MNASRLAPLLAAIVACVATLTLGCGSDAPPSAPVDGGRSDAADLSNSCTDLLCDNGTFCDGQERCARAGETGDARGCVSDATAVCATGESCDEDRDLCRACSNEDADGDGVSECANDCDDVDAARYPGASEMCDNDDEDCDAATVGTRDGDGDGFISSACCNGDVCGTDCDDAVPAIKPGAPELCNGLDDDCDGLIDVDDGVVARSYYPDADGDGFGDETATPIVACAAPDGYVTLGTDCDDVRVDVYPGQTESCNGRDDDCTLPIDPVSCACRVGTDPPTLCGYSSAAGPTRCSRVMGACVAPGVFNCPASGLINGSESETCNALDDDCDGMVDEALTISGCYLDADADMWGEASAGVVCASSTGGCPSGTTNRTGDCPGGAAVNPGAAEVCNGIDDECDGTIDDGTHVRRIDVPAAITPCAVHEFGRDMLCEQRMTTACQTPPYGDGCTDTGFYIAAGGVTTIGCLRPRVRRTDIMGWELMARHAGCNGSSDEYNACQAAAHRTCIEYYGASMGVVSGFTYLADGSPAARRYALMCVDGTQATVRSVTWAELDARDGSPTVAYCRGPSRDGFFCARAVDQWCREGGYVTGFGPMEYSAGGATVTCLRSY